MLNHKMSSSKLVAEARKDFPTLNDRCDAPLRKLRIAYELGDPNEELTHLLPWRSANRNNWLILMRYSKAGPSVYAMTWFHDEKGRIAALWTSRKGVSYLIDAHVIEHYGAVSHPTETPLEHLQSFFMENHFFAMQIEQPIGDDIWKVSLGLKHGLGMGEWDTTTDVVHFRTLLISGRFYDEHQVKPADLNVNSVLANYDFIPAQGQGSANVQFPVFARSR